MVTMDTSQKMEIIFMVRIIKCIFMKLFLLSVVLLIGTTSCTDQIVQNEEKPSGPVELTFSASNREMISGPTTRTLVREGLKTLWVANDRISLIDGANVNNPFITKDGGVVTNFKGKITQSSPDVIVPCIPTTVTLNLTKIRLSLQLPFTHTNMPNLEAMPPV